MTTSGVARVDRLAFFAMEGLGGWDLAERFAGPGGRVATLPDIVEARLASPEDTSVWCRYFTTTSAEYYGVTKGGVHVLAVAHGIGPMATREGAEEVYGRAPVDRDGRRRSDGRIDQSDFERLIDGAWGEVHVVDLESYLGRYEYPFSSMTAEAAARDPLAAARFGGSERLLRYLAAVTAFDDAHARGKGPLAARIPGRPLRLSQDCNDGYDTLRDRAGRPGYDHRPRGIEGGGARASLLAIAQLVEMSEFQGRSSVQTDVGTHGWSDGSRFAGWRAEAVPGDIPQDESLDWARRERPELLYADVEAGSSNPPLYALVRRSGTWFTQYPKEGACLDTAEPMHAVTALEPVGGPVPFTTSGSGMMFRYDLSEVVAVAPQGANAYALVGNASQESGNRMAHTVQFYAARVDTTRRLRSAGEIAADPQARIGLVEARLAA